jgi:hypothetical protein
MQLVRHNQAVGANYKPLEILAADGSQLLYVESYESPPHANKTHLLQAMVTATNSHDDAVALAYLALEYEHQLGTRSKLYQAARAFLAKVGA